ncbi:FxsA protein [Devosia sp. H5989]|nr:FxsA protein [Devosia sp. H5989]
MRSFIMLMLLTPLIEIAAFIKIGQSIGLWPTLLGVVVSAVVGVLVIQSRGLALGTQLRAAMNQGEMPARTVADAMMVFVAGVLLVIPGYFTSALGLLLLIPPVRNLLYAHMAKRTTVVASVHTASPRQERPRVIELDDDDYREH